VVADQEVRAVSKTGEKIKEHEGLSLATGDRQGFIHGKSLAGESAGLPCPGESSM
jgi:hypothetical protein